MLAFISVPKTEGKDFYERAKLALTWRICVVFFTILSIISIITYVTDDAFFLHYLFVTSINFISLVYIRIYKKYKIVAILITTATTLACISSIIFVPNVIHIIESLWLIVIALFSFFTLGKIGGSIFIIINIILYVTYFNTQFFINIENIENMGESMRIIMSVEFALSLLLIGYITHQFFEVNSYAERERKSAFEALKNEKEVINQQNEEKTILLQEIHHRVKNNLQVIISLLRIQADKLKSKEAINSFNEAVNRILSMALIHQKMYEKDSLAKIELEDYLSSLIEDIIASYDTHSSTELSLEINQESLGPNSIVPFALIINELVSNSLKHAFDGKQGAIKIGVTPLKDNFIELKYADNGIWKESEKDSFGLQLISVFTEQLEGSYELKKADSGTFYTFLLKNID